MKSKETSSQFEIPIMHQPALASVTCSSNICNKMHVYNRAGTSSFAVVRPKYWTGLQLIDMSWYNILTNSMEPGDT